MAEVEAKERNDDQQHDAALTAIGLFYLLLFKKLNLKYYFKLF